MHPTVTSTLGRGQIRATTRFRLAPGGGPRYHLPMPPLPPADQRGLAAAAGAFVLWGLVPVFWKALGDVGAVECLAHRFVWSATVTGALVLATGRARTVFGHDRWALRALACSGALIAANWATFIWAVQHGYILDTSLGYFINPLISIALGAVFLHEPVVGARRIAVGLAVLAVGYQSVALGLVPWISLLLALTFGLYGYVRKTAAVGSLDGLFVESLLMTPPALAYLGWLHAGGTSRFLRGDTHTDLLILATGPVTAIPLLLFAFGARRLPLSTVGFLQYIAPSLTFVLAITVYGEPLSGSRLVAFAIIWCALGLVAWEAWRSGASAAPTG
jgi:chloramphenicol-sensitive protein RarD